MSPIIKILSHILTLYMLGLHSAASDLPLISGHRHRPKPTATLSNPLITDEGKVYICLEKNLIIFQNDGSIIKRIPLNYTCNAGITPALGASGKVYLVAENRVLKVDTMYMTTPESAGEVFLGLGSGVLWPNDTEIIGLTASIPASCVIVNLKKWGLRAYEFDGRTKWGTDPAMHRFRFRYGCKKSVTGCFFVSTPVFDLCDANLYFSNNQGEVYAMSFLGTYVKWIQDLSFLNKNFTITAGNNGRLYVTVPERSIILALDVLTGSILWQNDIGPLGSLASAPVVDINGWISIGSLDGFLYSISPSGIVKKFPTRKKTDTVIQVNPVLDCSGYAVYISQTKMAGMIRRTDEENTYVSATRPVETIFTLLVPATGNVYWSESYPGSVSNLFLESDLRLFVVDERILLDFLSISNTGNPLSCFSTRQKLASTCSIMDIKKVSIYTGNEKAIELFLFYETSLLILLAALVRFCCVFWNKKKLQNQDLWNFLEKRSWLRLQKKVCDRTITELEKKTAEGSPSNEMLEKLGDLVKEREGIERKLSTTYSLGRDAPSPQSQSLIPLSDKKSKSFSFKSGQKESVDIFDIISNTSSEEYNSNEEKIESKGKALMEPESSSDDDGGDHEEIVEEQEVEITDEGDDNEEIVEEQGIIDEGDDLQSVVAVCERGRFL
ncbi:protein GAMETE EXPRESSED 3-like isoform X1 [Bidens hawaiensis]|uniref:protein GAMETE EXPRESSED 3-like isoform X1 n=1 Tax=Bidens hawaiensis TaxID=980011 RepID=UPI00404B8D5F